MKDQYGFEIWTDDDRKRMWDDKVTIEEKLVSSVVSKRFLSQIRQEFGNHFEMNDNEVILEYKYGGILSGRGGYIIVNQNAPTKILRSIATWMS